MLMVGVIKGKGQSWPFSSQACSGDSPEKLCLINFNTCRINCFFIKRNSGYRIEFNGIRAVLKRLNSRFLAIVQASNIFLTISCSDFQK